MDPSTHLHEESVDKVGTLNFVRLLSLLNDVASAFLRRSFINLWLTETQTAWENTPQDGQKLIKGLGQGLYTKCHHIQKRRLAEGNCETWDMPLLADILKLFKGSSIPPRKLDGLKEVRNQIAHLGSVTLETVEFEKLWMKATTILLSLGAEKEEIDHARHLKLGVVMQSERVAFGEYEKFKDAGNRLYKHKQFQAAIGAYTEGIALDGISNQQMAVLYSNRSVVQLVSGNVNEAKFDAKSCITLHPKWFRGYYRLAKVYEELQRYKQALWNHEMALLLNPDARDVLEARDYCRILVGKQERDDHLNPALQITTREAVREEMSRVGLGVLHGISKSVMGDFFKGLPHGICAEGHKYLHGLDGCQKDYEMAAKLFAKAARKENAEGLYNLAVLMQEGKGVQLNIQEGHRLLLQAANQDPMKELLPGSGVLTRNLGVAEAQHHLGLSYENGIGVGSNYAKAREWYEKAVENGSGFSANNLASMYFKGMGVEQDIEKGILYRKLGALKGSVRAAENLANIYLEWKQLELARDWYLYSVHWGSFKLTWNKESFGITPEQEKSFNAQQFLEQLQQELGATEFCHLATSYVDDIKKGIPSNAFDLLARIQSNRRVILIKSIREGINMEKTSDMQWEAGIGNYVPRVNIDLTGLKPITMQEFDHTIADKVYEGFILKVTVIEDAHIRASSIFLVVEDAGGSVERVYIYGYSRNGRVQEEIGYGTKFSIVNPYFRRMKDGEFGIRVDDPNTIFRHTAQADPKRCRYCGKANGPVPCRKCKRVFYCDKLCMKKDEKELKHGLVCIRNLKG